MSKLYELKDWKPSDQIIEQVDRVYIARNLFPRICFHFNWTKGTECLYKGHMVINQLNDQHINELTSIRDYFMNKSLWVPVESEAKGVDVLVYQKSTNVDP